MNEWSKKTTTELATRVPLIIRVPWKTASVGARTIVKAELVDLYRTLVDLAGLNSSKIQSNVQGASLAPLFDNPLTPPPSLSNKIAYSQIGSCGCKTYTVANWTGQECNLGRCAAVNVTDFNFMGYTMITPENMRYTLWAKMNKTTLRVNFNGKLFDELYDQSGDGSINGSADFDYDGYSNNIASENPTKVAQFREQLIAEVLSWY